MRHIRRRWSFRSKSPNAHGMDPATSMRDCGLTAAVALHPCSQLDRGTALKAGVGSEPADALLLSVMFHINWNNRKARKPHAWPFQPMIHQARLSLLPVCAPACMLPRAFEPAYRRMKRMRSSGSPTLLIITWSGTENAVYREQRRQACTSQVSNGSKLWEL